MTDDARKLMATLNSIRRSHRQHVTEHYPAPGICLARCPGPYPCSAARTATAAAIALVWAQILSESAPGIDNPLAAAGRDLRELITRSVLDGPWDVPPIANDEPASQEARDAVLDMVAALRTPQPLPGDLTERQA